MVNANNHAIVAVHANHIDRRIGSYDLLGDAVLPAGYYTTVEPRNHEGYCRFNIQVEFDNGDVQNIPDVNLCEATRVVTYGHQRNGFFHNVIY
jgi:hypothetical protein